ncbi:3-hydroxyacyl-CoA dehydrogenase NAD-binding domain-containing protein [Limoniibacter endophyticus]|uniref:3-hydroxyacyl-CoA dehydrogenase NAD-binding domain-containing protein n=1 Tax=Limoniibacter endophyticus TaxID=1565040 RepID=UPI001FCE54EB|nr:3-hydroxyacyl-CoA dehydrogenase NAD-binding domain-containing protein [Limoniibacter endophyticus]
MTTSLTFSDTVSGKAEGDVLVVTLNNPPVNAASAELRQGLWRALDHARSDNAVSAVVITGAGKSFVAGADIKEFGKPQVDPTLPAVVEKIEASEKPVIAAINGVALGGGCEIALAAHARIAHSKAKLGFPEVKLGIVPGAGGTQRLPRLVGCLEAVEMIGTGKPVNAEKAFGIGLIGAIAKGDLLSDALALAQSLKGKPVLRTSERIAPRSDQATVQNTIAKITLKAKGQMAPGEAMRLAASASTLSFTQGLSDERETFLRLRDSDQAKALRHVFFAERDAAKVDGLEHVEPLPLNKIGVCGLGLMGAGIATALLSAGYELIGYERDEPAAEAGKARILDILGKNLKSGRIDQADFERQAANLATTAKLRELAPCDLVIEAVFDDMTIKTELFQKLDLVIRSDAILATNTSYLDPDALAAETAHPERVIGLHFFSPANIMRLVEVVRCAQATPQAVATGFALAKKLGKLPIVTGVCEGFIGNSIFSAYRREAEFLLEDGALPQEIDAAMEDYGMAMGPFAVFDLAGLEIAWARRKREAPTRDPEARYVDIADRLCEAGRLGQKSGRGWYSYEAGKRTVDSAVTEMIAQSRAAKGITPRAIASEEIVKRLIGAMADEGKTLLDKAIAARASDIDLVMINGYGFPAYRGGPMFAASR